MPLDVLTLGTAAISKTAPAGESCRFDPAFEELQDLVDRSPTSSETKIDWSRVVELSRQILAEQTKDLAAAGYLTLGLIRTQSLAGLADGLTVYRDVLRNFWDGLQPPLSRMRGRRMAIDWLWEKTSSFLRSLEREPQKAELIATVTDRVSEIEAFLQEKIADNPPLSLDLFPLLKQMRKIDEAKNSDSTTPEEPAVTDAGVAEKKKHPLHRPPQPAILAMFNPNPQSARSILPRRQTLVWNERSKIYAA